MLVQRSVNRPPFGLKNTVKQDILLDFLFKIWYNFCNVWAF